VGEATYHLRAEFAQPISEDLLDRIDQFIVEGINANDWWQRRRDWERMGLRDTFWGEFTHLFPVVTKFLGDKVGGGCDNDLTGWDFGSDPDDSPPRIGRTPNELIYSAVVWHFSDWDPFCTFLKTHFGAIKAGWVSDEYVGDLSPLVEMT
jgi:hypothetical protein